MNSKEIFEVIVSNLRDILPEIEHEPIEYGSRLCLLGTGSVGRAELIEKTLEDLEIEANRFEFHAAANLGELAEMFTQRVNAKSA